MLESRAVEDHVIEKHVVLLTHCDWLHLVLPEAAGLKIIAADRVDWLIGESHVEVMGQSVSGQDVCHRRTA